MFFSLRAWSVPCLLACSKLSQEWSQENLSSRVAGQVACDSESQAASSTGRGGGRTLTEFRDNMCTTDRLHAGPTGTCSCGCRNGRQECMSARFFESLLLSCGAKSPNLAKLIQDSLISPASTFNSRCTLSGFSGSSVLPSTAHRCNSIRVGIQDVAACACGLRGDWSHSGCCSGTLRRSRLLLSLSLAPPSRVQPAIACQPRFLLFSPSACRCHWELCRVHQTLFAKEADIMTILCALLKGWADLAVFSLELGSRQLLAPAPCLCLLRFRSKGFHGKLCRLCRALRSRDMNTAGGFR